MDYALPGELLGRWEEVKASGMGQRAAGGGAGGRIGKGGGGFFWMLVVTWLYHWAYSEARTMINMVIDVQNVSYRILTFC